MATNYSPKIVTDGLVLCLDAANPKSYPGTGTVWKDLSGNGNDGTLVNGVGYSSDNNGVMTFDGTNQGVNIADTVDINLQDYSKRSIEVWFKTGDSVSSRQILWEEGGGINSFVTYVENGTLYTVGASKSHGWDTQTFHTFSVVPNTWYQSVQVLDASSDSLQSEVYIGYANGSLLSKESGSNMSAHSGNITIGYSSDGYVGHDGNASSGSYLSGRISVIKVSNYALTSQEIQQNYQALRGRYGI